MTLQSTTTSIESIDGTKSILDIFGDPRMARNISKKLHKHPEKDTVTQSELNKVKELYRDWEIHPISFFNIACIQYLKNLTCLSLQNGEIVDVEPISKLTNLHGLYLPNNKIVDIQPLSKLKYLVSLGLSHNLISDLTPLHKIGSLRCLYLMNNRIKDVSPLGSLVDLEILSLGQNPIKTLSSLKYLKNLSKFWDIVMYFPKEVYQDLPIFDCNYNKNKPKGFLSLLYNKIMGREW